MTFCFEVFLLLFKKWLYFIQLSNYAAKIRFNIYTVYTYIYQDMPHWVKDGKDNLSIYKYLKFSTFKIYPV